MPSPSEAALTKARAYLASHIRVNEGDVMQLAHRLDSFAAAQVEAAVAAARAEMRERCEWAACPIHEKHLLTERWRGRRRAADDIRALPLDPEVTK